MQAVQATPSSILTPEAHPVTSLGPPPLRLALVPARPGVLPESMSETQPGFRILEPETGETEPRVLLGTLIETGAEDQTQSERTRTRAILPTDPRAVRRMRALAAMAAVALLAAALLVVFVKRPRAPNLSPPGSELPARELPKALAPVPRTAEPTRRGADEEPEMLAPLEDVSRPPLRSTPPRSTPPRAKPPRGR